MKIIDRSADEIIDLGLQMAKHQGFGTFTIRDVAQEAGVSVGTIYNLVGDKDTLVGRIMERFWRQTLNIDLERIEAEPIPFLPKVAKIYKLFKARSEEFHDTLLQNFAASPRVKDEARCARMDYMQLIQERIAELLRSYPLLDDALEKAHRQAEVSEFIADFILAGIRRSDPSLGFFEEVLASYLITLSPKAKSEIL